MRPETFLRTREAWTRGNAARYLTRYLFGGAPALMIACAVSACAPTRGEEIAANVKTIRRDQKPARLIEIGKGFASVGDLTRAEEYFAAALEHGGDEKEILPLLLRVCILDGRYRSAIQYAENHLVHSPRDTATRFVLGTLYSATGDADKAHETYDQVLEVEPNNADAHFALAVLLRDIGGDPVGADHHFREYLRLKPGGPHVEEAQASLLKAVPPPTLAPMQGPTRIDPPDAEPPSVNQKD